MDRGGKALRRVKGEKEQSLGPKHASDRPRSVREAIPTRAGVLIATNGTREIMKNGGGETQPKFPSEAC